MKEFILNTLPTVLPSVPIRSCVSKLNSLLLNKKGHGDVPWPWFGQRKLYKAPSCFKYFSEFAFTFSGGFRLNAILKFLIAFVLSPFVA